MSLKLSRAWPKPETDDSENLPSVAVGDSIYYRHPETGAAHHGVVAALGKHGVTTDADGGGEHQVRWASFLGHRRRAERKLTIVDRGEDGCIMEDEDGKRVYVRGSIEDYEQGHNQPQDADTHDDPEKDERLIKAQVVRELASAGFEPMVDYVRDNFGDGFVYRHPLEPSAGNQDVVDAISRLAAQQAAQFQGLCAAISMLADQVTRKGIGE